MDVLLEFLLILCGGFLIGLAASRFRIPDGLPLILAGFLIPGLPGEMVSIVALVAVAVFSFDDAYHFRIDALSKRFVMASLGFIFVLFAFLGILFDFGAVSSLLAAILSSGAIIGAYGFSFIFVDYGISWFSLLVKVLGGIGSGLVVGFIAYRIVRHYKNRFYQGLVMFFAAMLSFVLAHSLDAYGVFASISVAFFYARFVNADIDHSFTRLLGIVVFVLLGATIHPSWHEVVFGLFAYSIYVLVRLSIAGLVLRECATARATFFPVRSVAALLLFFSPFEFSGVLLSFLIFALVARWIFKNAGIY